MGLGSDWRTKYAEAEDRGDPARNRSAFLISRSTTFWGASRSAHTLLEKKESGCVCGGALPFHQAT